MKQPLGRGLESLISQGPKKNKQIKDPHANIKGKRESIFSVEIHKVDPNPHQPRKDFNEDSLKELAASIREHGILQPLVVTKSEKISSRGRDVRYELIAGERRLRAAKLAKLKQVPIIIRDSQEHEKVEMALVENLQRENLNPIDMALGFKQLQSDFAMTVSEIGEKVGRSQSAVSNLMRLLTLPKEAQDALSKKQITEKKGRALLMAKPTARLTLFRRAMRKEWDANRIEREAKKIGGSLSSQKRGRGPKSPYFRKLEHDLELVLGRRVAINRREKVGAIRIEFNDDKDLNKLIKGLKKLA